jgi:hypothetical protein
VIYATMNTLNKYVREHFWTVFWWTIIIVIVAIVVLPNRIKPTGPAVDLEERPISTVIPEDL